MIVLINIKIRRINMSKKEKIFLCIIIVLILIVIFMVCVAKKYYNIAEENLNHYIDACDEIWEKEQKIMELENKN